MICGSADIIDGRVACQAIEVQLLVMLFALADLLGNGLFVLPELFNGLQSIRGMLAVAELGLLVGLEAVLAQEYVAPLAVVSSVHSEHTQLRLPCRHPLRFYQIPQGKVDL